MKYFLIFLLTLVLISCNEKKGYGKIRIEYGVKTTDISAKECRDANATGNTITILNQEDPFYFKLVYYKNYVYRISQYLDQHFCEYKMKYHDKWLNLG